MHVAQVGFYLDPRHRGPLELLRDWPSLVDIAEAVAGSVRRLSVVQACAQAASVTQRGVSYHFVPSAQAAAPRSAESARNEAIVDCVLDLHPDVIHVHGLDFSDAVIALARRLPKTPILLQDHASRLPRIWRRRLWRRGAACAAGIAICARDQLAPYWSAGLLPAALQVFEIPESSSRFTPGDAAQARGVTALSGDPAVLWVGRLDANKDPLIVLEALRRVTARLPGIELWCAYGSTDLLQEVRRQVDADPLLRPRVHLLGAVPHKQVELLMNAADLYVSASHREGSGYALIEALACGLPPVVTDIPSFRALTGGGSVGALWSCGDADELAAGLIKAAGWPREAARAQVRAHFNKELSFEAVGRKLATAYARLVDRMPRRVP